MTVNFYLEMNPKCRDRRTVFCYVRANGKTLVLNTYRKVEIKYWNKEFQLTNPRLTKNTAIKQELNKTNKHLAKFREKIEKIEEGLTNSFTRVHFNELKTAILETYKPKPKKEFYDIFEDFITTKKYTVQSEAIQKYKRLKQILLQFDKDLTFDKINFTFYDNFLPFLNNKLNLQNNTAYYQIQTLKTFLQWATDREFNTNTKFKSFKAKKTKTTIVTLSTAEIRTLYNYDFKNERLERARDIFVFQCQVGTRYSDIFKMDLDEIKNGYFVFRQKKTKDDVKIELSEIALEILRKYSDYPKPLPIISEQKVNKYIKEACKIAGFHEPIKKYTYKGITESVITYEKWELITTHTARRSFITNSLIAGKSIPEVMRNSGHKNLTSFQKYIDLSQQFVKEPKLKMVK